MSTTSLISLINSTNNITILCIVILTPTLVSLIFNSQEVMCQVNKVRVFFKDQNYTRDNKYKQILYYINITLYNNIRVILKYTRILFNKKVFFIILKKKYYNYNNNYTKYTYSFLNILVLLVQCRQIKSKNFIKLFYQVSTNLKERKLLNKVKQTNLFLYILLDQICSKIIKKYNVDQDNKKTLIYNDFYKTTIRVYKSNKVIN